MIGFAIGFAVGVILCQLWRLTDRTVPGSAEQDRPFAKTVTMVASGPIGKGQMVRLNSQGRAVGM